MEMNYGLKKVINGLQGLKEEPLTEKRDQGQNGQFQSNLEKTIQLVKLFASGFNYLKEEPTQVKGEEKSSSAEKVSAEIVPHVASSSSSSSNHQSIKAEPPMKMPVHQLIPNYIPDSSNKSNQKPGVTLSPKSSSSSNIIEEDVLRHPEKYSPQQRGFLRIKQYLAKLESKMPELVPSVTIKCLKDSNGNDTSSISNVVFKYNNNPMSGWKKEVKLRMAGKTKGKFDVSYINEKYERRLSSKGEVLQFVEEEKLHPSIGEKFDFRSVFCVCQTSEDPCRNFIECSYGFCGCNAWIHPECVGLGARSEEDLQKMKKAICPFCSYYLEGAGQIDQFSKDTLILRDITVGTIVTDNVLDDFDIEETNLPHRIWGLEGSHCSFEQKGKIFKPVFPYREAVLDILLDPHRRSSVGNSNVVISYNNPKNVEANRVPAKRGRKRLYDPTSNWQHALLKGSGRTNTNTAQSDSESEVEAEDNTPLRDKRQVIYFEGKKIEVGVKGGFVGMEKDRPHLMSEEELMRIRITQKIKSLEGLEHTPSNLMEKELLDLMLTSSKFIQKQKKNPVGRPTNVTEYSEKDINSLMAFIPLDDGGVRMATVATNMQPKSLHKLCTEKCCGFCFDRFTEADHENITDVILGAMEYPLHEYCFMMFQQNKFIAQPSPNIVIEGVHMCATIDDVDCDLCGRTGGILVEFQLDKSITSAAPSDANHWVGHVPCLQFVASSKLFSPPVDSPENMESERAKARLIKIQPNETTSIEPRSLFDVLFQANRCALCGGEGGIVPRCIAANCCARAHPLCCMLTDKWLIADFSLKGQNTKARGLLCPAHKKHMK